ncbi:MAG: hypothetical protein OHK0019_05440 [Saprospiraceae bacterium]
MLAQTRLLLALPLTPGWLDGFVLGGGVFAYNFTHRDRLRKTAAWLGAMLGCTCFLWPLDFAMSGWQVSVLAPLLMWLLYYGLQRPGNGGLRGVPAAKPFVVALVWAWVTVLLPVPPERWSEAAFIFLGRAAFIFALALAYDIADEASDRRQGLATLAGQLGVSKTFVLINSALIMAALCALANYLFNVYALHLSISMTASLAFSTWWLRFLLTKTEWRNWQKVWIDALMVGQFLMLWGSAIFMRQQSRFLLFFIG